jgi:ATP adenylyltransferase
MSGCFLCAKVKGNRDDESYILYRGELAFVVLNLYPYNPGHLMVAPYTHTGKIEELDTPASAFMWKLTTMVVDVLAAEYKPEGFNIGLNLGRAAGAGLVDHLHVHIVPRWAGDTNFMPVLGEAKVISEGLESTYKRLKPRFQGRKI